MDMMEKDINVMPPHIHIHTYTRTLICAYIYSNMHACILHRQA